MPPTLASPGTVRDAASAVEELRAAQEAWQGLQGRLMEEQQQRCRRPGLLPGPLQFWSSV